MLAAALFFTLCFATLVAMIWSGIHLLGGANGEDSSPLDDRLDELTAAGGAAQVVSRGSRRRYTASGGVLNLLMYLISLFPGGEDWLRDNERELGAAGVRSRDVVALYCVGHVGFLLICLGGMLYLQWENELAKK